MASLYFLADSQFNISRSVTYIVKKIMTRNLALMCTAQKKMEGKTALKDTPLYKCIVGKKIKFIYVITFDDHYRNNKFY